MAGTLVVNSNDSWMPPGWIWDLVFEEAATQLADKQPGLSQRLREVNTDAAFPYLDITEWSAQELLELHAAVIKCRTLRLAAGPLSLVKPEYFGGLIAQMSSLSDTLSRDRRICVS